MKNLIIDTSSEYCMLGVAEGGALIKHTLFLHENCLSRFLLPEISTLLDKVELPLKSIAQISVGVGPGSYTGTRVGVAVAKSLSFGLNIPLRGFCSLVVFLPPCYGRFASILPAKSGQFFILKGEKTKNRITLDRTHLISKSKLQEEIKNVDFVTAKKGEDLKTIKEFFPFEPQVENVACALRSPPKFPFEIDARLIYLHTPD